MQMLDEQSHKLTELSQKLILQSSQSGHIQSTLDRLDKSLQKVEEN